MMEPEIFFHLHRLANTGTTVVEDGAELDALMRECPSELGPLEVEFRFASLAELNDFVGNLAPDELRQLLIDNPHLRAFDPGSTEDGELRYVTAEGTTLARFEFSGPIRYAGPMVTRAVASGRIDHAVLCDKSGKPAFELTTAMPPFNEPPDFEVENTWLNKGDQVGLTIETEPVN